MTGCMASRVEEGKGHVMRKEMLRSKAVLQFERLN